MGIGFSTTLTNMHLRGPGIATSMVAASLHRELSLVSGATTSMSVSTGFKLFLGSLLGVIILLQLVLMVLVYKHRNTSTLRLHQPHVLLVYVAIAAFTTGSCILFIPFNDTSCMLLDFFLVLPITVMGNTLVARSWRVNTLMIAALGIGREDESPNAKRRRIIKLSLMDFLTFVVRLDRTRTWGPSRRASSSYFFDARSLHRKNTTLQLPHRTSSSLRQKVTTMQLTCLAMILTLPQLVVQLCKLCIPSLQSELIYSSCHESSGGEVLRWVGLVLAVIPLVMLIMLSLYTGGLPLLGIYSSSVLQPIGIVVGTAVVAGPSIFLSISLETKVYLQSCIVNSFTCGTCWFVVAQKLILTFQNEREEVNKTMLRVEKKQHLEGIDSEENEKAAT